MMRLFILLIVFSYQLQANDAEPLPKAFGYVIGDILEQRVSLTNEGAPIELAELPILQRVGPWVQRLSVKTSQDEQGAPWLSIRYQIINAPLEPKEIALPALALPTTTGATFEIFAQPFSISPLTLQRKPENNNLPFMQADRIPAASDGQAAKKRIRLALVLLAVTAFLWAAWWLWLQRRDKTRLPFSKALHKLRLLRRATQADLNENAQAWSAVHEAFNSVVGQTLSSRTAIKQLSNRQWLEPFSTDIQAFYKASDERFFKPNAPSDSFELYNFCKALYRAEKQNTAQISSEASP